MPAAELSPPLRSLPLWRLLPRSPGSSPARAVGLRRRYGGATAGWGWVCASRALTPPTPPLPWSRQPSCAPCGRRPGPRLSGLQRPPGRELSAPPPQLLPAALPAAPAPSRQNPDWTTPRPVMSRSRAYERPSQRQPPPPPPAGAGDSLWTEGRALRCCFGCQSK